MDLKGEGCWGGTIRERGGEGNWVLDVIYEFFFLRKKKEIRRDGRIRGVRNVLYECILLTLVQSCQGPRRLSVPW